ncbi:hypothetical protein X777_03450 [Ooceraea biroi]|uniref:Uncharacterized protein n=1 Tax=Ooceraea biroi TaxID=2015173 RepID=A0A026VSR5_OOCBI|nr:hypothetical protein X777_03450 [Ooceraea biroi]
MTISYACGDQLKLKRKDRKGKSDSMRRCEHLPPDGSGEGDDGVRRFHGDGLVVRMHSNHRVLKITGDGCRIALSKNSGSVHIIGDGCRVRVNRNEGNIEYTGDGGRVLLGSESVKGKVKFVGDGGKVILDSSRVETESKTERKDSGNSSGERSNEEASYVEKDACSCKKVINATLGCEKRAVGNGTLNQEELDNVTNDVKERNQGKYRKRNEETRKSLRHRTVAKIITKIQSDGQCVRKRFFGDSSFIVNSRSDEKCISFRDEKCVENFAQKRQD